MILAVYLGKRHKRGILGRWGKWCQGKGGKNPITDFVDDSVTEIINAGFQPRIKIFLKVSMRDDVLTTYDG
jgi:hypothetical protein